MRRRSFSTALLGALMAATLGISAAQAGGGGVVMVDGDGRATQASCNTGAAGSARKKIQKAIDAVSDGGTVLVCPGTYIENVVITEKSGVTVRSTIPFEARIQADPTPDPSEAPGIVSIYGATGITFRGFTVVTKPAEDCAAPLAGILIVGAQDFMVRGNRVRNLGQTFGDCGFPIGIMAGFGLFFGPVSVSPAGPPIEDLSTIGAIAYNAVQDHQFIGIASISTFIDDDPELVTGPTRVDILNNSVRYYHLKVGEGSCLVGSNAVSGRVKRELRQDVRGAGPAGPGIPCEGIGIYQGAGIEDSPIPGASGKIKRNRVSSGPNAGVEATAGADSTPLQTFGILQVDQRHTPGSTQIADNLTLRNFFGIAAVDATNTVIEDNRTRGSLGGILVWDTEGAIVRGNDSQANDVGIVVDDEPIFTGEEDWYVAGDVTVRGNDARGNLGNSCLDDAVKGDPNTWIDNQGELDSSEPAGICGPASP